MKSRNKARRSLARVGLLTQVLSRRQSPQRWQAAALLSMATFGAAVTSAQIPTATLSGTVHDQTGAIIPNAAVQLKNESTSDTRSVNSNGAGAFRFSALQSGTYDVIVDAPGFAKFTQKGVHLDPGDQRDLSDLALNVSSAGEQVVVEAQAGRIDTTSGETSSLITSNDIEKLAVEGRDVTELFKILPGFAIANQGVSNTAYDPSQVSVNGAIGSYAANGSPLSSVSLKWDGANITDPGNYGAGIQNVNYDMVSEVKVQTANFGAELSNGPVVVNAVTKSGSSAFHGDLYTYARTSQLNATDALAKALNYAKPPDRYVYPGIDISGPVSLPGSKFNRNGRVTFFAGAEDYAQRNNYAYGSASQAIIHALVPTQAMRSGDFSQAQIQQYLGSNAKLGQGYDNLVNSPTVGKDNAAIVNGNIARYIDPGMQSVFNLLPLPNIASNGRYNFITQNLINNNLWQAVGRTDVAFSPKYKFFARYSIERGGSGIPEVPYYSPANSGPGMGGIDTPGGGLVNTIDSQSAAANLTMLLNSTTTNEVFGSLAYLDSAFAARNNSALQLATYNFPYHGAYSQNGSSSLPQFADYGNDGLPLLETQDFSYGSIFAKKFDPNGGDNFTKVIHNNTLELGVYVERVTNNQRQPFGTTNGTFQNYYDPPSFLDVDGKTTIYTSGNYLANELEGIFQGYSQQNLLPDINLKFWNVDEYVNDIWKVHNNLTLTLGLRLEHLGMWNDAHGLGVAVFDPSTLSQTASAARPLPGFRWHALDPSVPTSGVSSYPLFVEPRLGFSYDVSGKGKTVVRGGFGQYRFHDSWNDASNAVSSTVGLRSTYISSSSGNGVTLAGVNSLNLPQNYGGLNTTAFGLAMGDNRTAVTETYSLAVDQILPYRTQMEVSYIGNNSHNLLTSGSNQTVNLENINALPLGALFAPGVTAAIPGTPLPYQVQALGTTDINRHRPYSTNPYNPATGQFGPSPYGSTVDYGAIDVPQHNAVGNYNAIQVSVARQTGALNYGINYTFGKALATLGGVGNGNPVSAVDVNADYGIATYDRTHIFNANYSYTVGTPVKNKIIGGFANGWQISGISQLQSGVDLQIGTGPSNFSPVVALTGTNYVDPTMPNSTVNYTGLGLLGTPDVQVQPTLISNPKAGLGPHSFINGNAFRIAARGQNGPSFYPYLHGPAFFDTDLSAQKAFHFNERNQLQFRASAFNFVNHALYSFNGARSNEYSQLTFNGATPESAIPNVTAGAAAGTGSQFGTATLKQGRRILEVSVKYVF